jgi:hypothetical protein
MSDVDVDDQYIDKSASWILIVPVAWHVAHERTIALTTPCDAWTIVIQLHACKTDQDQSYHPVYIYVTVLVKHKYIIQ